MCNISGYIGKKKGNITILKMLAIIGRLRGTDSTGFYFNNKVYKFASPGDSLEILNGVCIYHSKKNNENVFITHNRSKTIGAVNVDNAHPYEYDYIKDRHLIFMHNGTIKNIAELCKKYNIEHSSLKTDSYFFGKLLYEQGSKILSEYEGFAAVAAYDVKKGILYLFKGSSQCEADKVTKDERPLHIYKKPGLLYFNSTAEGLVTALNTQDGVQEFPANVLIGFNNNAEEVSRIDIDRSHITYSSYTNNDWSGYSNYTNNNYNNVVLSMEPSPQNKYGNLIYYWRGSYYKNGHLINGIYSVDEKGDSNWISEKTYSNYVVANLNRNDIYFFYKGFLIKNYSTYQDLLKANKSHYDYTIYDFAQMLHPESIYMRLYSSGVSAALYKNGVSVPYTTWVQPKWSCFRYKLSYKGVEYEEIADVTAVDNIKLINAYSNEDDTHIQLDSFQTALFQ